MPTDRHPGPWLDLVGLVIPDEAARRHLLDCLAHLVQKPDKVNHALFLGGGQGIGKDSMFDPIVAAVGAHNVGLVTQLDLDVQFNDFVLNRRLLMAEELIARENWRSLANKLKPLLAAPSPPVVVMAFRIPSPRGRPLIP